jgi:serine/threonine protein kinase
MPRPMKLGPHDPTEIGPYTLLARLGRGGQGEVYLAADPDGNRVAVKVLKVDWDASGTLKRNLDRELVNARKVAQFVTAKVLDFDVVGDEPYIVSEYIEGPTLAEHVREQGPLQDSELLQVAVQTLTALEAIHHARIIHCDFKPANIILGPRSARVIDFGIAQALDSTHRAGEVAGTFPFMAPEQIADRPLTSAVDLFAWGSTMVFAAADGQAFPGESRQIVAERILTRPPELYGTDEPLRSIIQACLQKSPERRPNAAQARRMLLSPRKRPAAGQRAPAAPVPEARMPRTKVERPVPRPAPPPPAPVAGEHGNSTRNAVVALVAAIAVAAVVAIAASPGFSGESDKDGPKPQAESTLPTSVGPLDGADVLAQYERFWPEVACASTTASPGQVERDSCAVSHDGVAMLLFCVLYDGKTAMATKGRPAGGDNNIAKSDVAWRSRWYREADDRHGDFIAYRLKSGKTAIWWEDSALPLACFLHGPPGTEPDLLAAFFEHGFQLRDPVPSSN